MPLAHSLILSKEAAEEEEEEKEPTNLRELVFLGRSTSLSLSGRERERERERELNVISREKSVDEEKRRESHLAATTCAVSAVKATAAVLPSLCTEWMEWMLHSKRRETKQQPSMLPCPAVPGCCLVSFRFLCDMHSKHSMYFELQQFNVEVYKQAFKLHGQDWGFLSDRNVRPRPQMSRGMVEKGGRK